MVDVRLGRMQPSGSIVALVREMPGMASGVRRLQEHQDGEPVNPIKKLTKVSVGPNSPKQAVATIILFVGAVATCAGAAVAFLLLIAGAGAIHEASGVPAWLTLGSVGGALLVAGYLYATRGATDE